MGDEALANRAARDLEKVNVSPDNDASDAGRAFRHFVGIYKQGISAVHDRLEAEFPRLGHPDIPRSVSSWESFFKDSSERDRVARRYLRRDIAKARFGEEEQQSLLAKA